MARRSSAVSSHLGGRQYTYHCSYTGKRQRSRDGSESAGDPHAGTDQRAEYTAAAYGADGNLDRSQDPLPPRQLHHVRENEQHGRGCAYV